MNNPKQVVLLNKLIALQISCGAFHTGIIANEESKVNYIPIPSALRPVSRSSSSSSSRRSALTSIVEDDAALGESSGDRTAGNNHYGISTDFFSCGDLYCCGVGKAGQLGLPGDGKKPVMRPTLVPFFEESGHHVVQVSCGFHHTLVIASPKAAVRTFTTSVYAFGWNEYGRLGTGDEEQRMLPEQIQFDLPFHPTCISAGEQHSLACNRDHAYSWGSNSMGQLGLSNPSITDMMLVPQPIPLPEGMKLRTMVAGGRHSAALTECNRVLTWGWAEEGQTGHGNERNSYLAKPCKLPKMITLSDYKHLSENSEYFSMRSHNKSDNSCPVQLALGIAHTVILTRNTNHEEELPKPPSPEPEPIPPIAEPEPDPEPEPEPEPEPVVEIVQEVISKPKRGALISADDDEEEEEIQPEVEEQPEPTPPPPKPVEAVRSLRDLLNQREDRNASRKYVLYARYAFNLSVWCNINPTVLCY